MRLNGGAVLALLLLGIATIIERSGVFIGVLGVSIVALTAVTDRPSRRSALPLAWLLWAVALVSWRVGSESAQAVAPAAVYLLTALDRRPVRNAERGLALGAIAAVSFVPVLAWVPALIGLWRVRFALYARGQSALVQWFALVILVNGIVFLPGFILQAGRNKFLPFKPDAVNGLSMSWDWGVIPSYLGSLIFARDNIDIFRGSVELCFALVVVLRWPRLLTARVFAVTWIVVLLMTTYDDVIAVQLGRGAAWRVDLIYLTPLVDYARSAFGVAALAGLVVVALGGFALLFYGVGRSGGWLRRLESVPLGRRRRWASAVLLVVLASHLGGLGANSQNRQSRSVVTELRENILRSRALSTVGAESRRALVKRFSGSPPSPVPEPLANVYVFLVESYGRVLFSDPRYAPFWTDRIRELGARFDANGWRARSAWAETTVCGGGSWMSAASLHLGFPFRDQANYNAVANQTPLRWAAEPHSLFQVLASSGYETVSVQPGHVRSEISRLWGAQHQLNARALRYDGRAFGYGGIPDQYALRRVSVELPENRPRALFFENVSSHHPWIVPEIIDADSALDAERYVAAPSNGVPNYLQATEYALTVLERYLAGRDGVAVLVGDHQPPFHCSGEPRVVPLHVVSTNGAPEEFFTGVRSLAGFELSPALPAELGLWDIAPRLLDELRARASNSR